jgi:hypothetical protein
VRLVVAALLSVAVSFGVGGALLGAAWIDAKGDENAQQFGCFIGVNRDDDTAYELVERDGTYICVFLDESGRVIEQLPADDGIGRGDVLAIMAVGALLAGFFGLLLALGVLAMLWVLSQVARALRPTPQV